MTRPRILIVVYGGGHIAAVLSIIRELRSRDRADVVVLGLTTAMAVLRREGIPALGYVDFIEPGDESALALGARLSMGLPEGGPVAPAESRAYLGINYRELEDRLGPAEAEERYRMEGRGAFLPLRFLGRILDRVRPDLVLSTNSPRSEQAALEAAAARGIPQVCIKDMFGTSDLERLSQPGFGGVLCVFSESIKRKLVALGRSPAEIEVTGNPDFDRLSRPDLAERAAKLRGTFGWEENRVLLWASHLWQCDPPFPGRVEKELMEICRRNPSWRLMIRPHPSEVRSAVELPSWALLSRGGDDLAVQLAAADVTVTMVSTVGLQARLLGKRMVSVVPSCGTDRDLYQRNDLATRCTTELESLESVLKEALSMPEGRPDGFPLVGTATENVLQVVRRLLAVDV